MVGSTDLHGQWQDAARQERARLMTALGEITEGGVITDIQHIGSTSMDSLPIQPTVDQAVTVDLALAVYPFPLEIADLERLGYFITHAQPGEYEQRARHTSGNFQLFICEPGSDEWANHLLVRDYLRHDEDAQWLYAARKVADDSLEGARIKEALFHELRVAAHRWWPNHYGFRPVEAVVQELEGFNQLWFVSSGWALDLFRQNVSRYHHDVDVVIARTDQLALREHLSARGWRFVTPLKGKLEAWPAHMRLELPRHQVHAHRDGQFIDFLLTDMTPDLWHYRRNPLILRRMQQAGMRTSEGIPYLAPELVLLFKSKNTGTRERVQDQADFENARHHLNAEARAWLRWALTATDPMHAWIELLV